MQLATAVNVSYGFDFSRRPVFPPAVPAASRPAGRASRSGWLYLGSRIIYGLVLSINTPVTWPQGRPPRAGLRRGEEKGYSLKKRGIRA